MDWYVAVKYVNGTTENMYCTTRQEARQYRRDILAWLDVYSATVRRVA